MFASKGYAGATNRDIADAAGVASPGLIYHYFASKEDLLRATIEAHAPPLQLLSHAEALMALPPAEALGRFAAAYLGLMADEKCGALMRVLIGEALRSAEFAAVLAEVGPVRFFRLLASYLDRKMDEGILRRTDPLLAARCFLGPLVSYVLGRVILRIPDDPELSPHSLTAAAIDVFLHGLEAT